jgi:hypothetical protein
MSSSYEPTSATAGHAATVAPVRPPAASASCRNRVGPYRKPTSPCSPGKPALPSRCGRVRANVRVQAGISEAVGALHWRFRTSASTAGRAPAAVWGDVAVAQHTARSCSAEMPRREACTAGFGTMAFSRDSRSCACPATTPRARPSGARSRCKAVRAMRRIVNAEE